MLRKIFGLAVLGIVLGSFTQAQAATANRTPDQLFPAEARASSLTARQIAANAAAKAQLAGASLTAEDIQKNWAIPENARDPAHYSDLLLLQQRIEMLEKKLEKK